MTIQSYKEQIEESEELASFNLAKYKKARKDVEEANERAIQAEDALSRLKSKPIHRENWEIENLWFIWSILNPFSIQIVKLFDAENVVKFIWETFTCTLFLIFEASFHRLNYLRCST